MKRFYGMLIVVAGVLGAMVALGAGFYLAAGGLASAAVWLGAPPSYGAAVANLLTLLMVLGMGLASLRVAAERSGGILPGDIALIRFDWDRRNAEHGVYPA